MATALQPTTVPQPIPHSSWPGQPCSPAQPSPADPVPQPGCSGRPCSPALARRSAYGVHQTLARSPAGQILPSCLLTKSPQQRPTIFWKNVWPTLPFDPYILLKTTQNIDTLIKMCCKCITKSPTLWRSDPINCAKCLTWCTPRGTADGRSPCPSLWARLLHVGGVINCWINFCLPLFTSNVLWVWVIQDWPHIILIF